MTTSIQKISSPGLSGQAGRLVRRPETGAFLGMVAVYIFFAVLGGEIFLSSAGYASWLNIAAEVGIVAIPVGLLMIAGELDISVGSVIPASSITVAIVSGLFDLPDGVGVLAGLLVGVLVGLVNGYLVVKTNIPSLIITIGTMFGMMGLTLGLTVLIAGSVGVSIVPGETATALFGQYIADMFQITIFWWLGFAAAVLFFLHYSKYGNWVFALGGDRDSARNAGIPTDKVTIGLYVLSGTAAAFVGVSQVITYQTAQVMAGQSFIFNSIMCVVIGGVLLTGGFGSIIGIMFGTITFAIVNQGIFFTGLDPNFGSIIVGALLLVAVLTNDLFRKLAVNYSPKKK